MAYIPHNYEPDTFEAEVLKCIGSLSNHIIAVSNSKILQGLKASNPEVFKSAKLYLFALRLTCEYEFKLPVYRFIQDLFESVEWTVDAIEILNKSHGLRHTTPALLYNFSANESHERFTDNRKSSHSFNQDIKYTFKPAKLLKGF